MNKRCLGALLLLSLSACAVGADYEPASVEEVLTDKQWHNPLPHAGDVSDLSKWWGQFDDTALTQLIEKAESNSPTLEAALARVEQARATVAKNNAGFWPSLTGAASLRRSQTGSMGIETQHTTRMASFDAAWEIDLFGGQRRAAEQAEAHMQSSEALWHDARITLAAEVADAYVEYKSCIEGVSLYENVTNSRAATNDLVGIKLKAGLSSGSDADLSEATMASSSSQLDSKKSLCAQKFNTIAMLTGFSAGDLSSVIGSGKNGVPLPRDAAVTALPASAVEQRPDVASAERKLAAASAAIGVAKAAQYPSITLAGAIGINKTSSSPSANTWSFGPSVSVPIFNAGSLAAEVDRSTAAFDEALANYKDTVRRAVKEVEDALVRLDAIGRRIKQEEDGARLYGSRFDAVDASYKAGSASLLELEDARRSKLSAEESLLAARQEKAQAWIALYKAVGGGWDKNSKTQK